MGKRLKLRALLLAFVIVCIIGLTGCSILQARTVYIPAGDPVQIRENLKGVKVWVFVDGKRQASKMDIPEGWYALDDNYEK